MIEPNFVFVNVQVTSAPATRVMVAVPRAGVADCRPCEQSRPVRAQPATAPSVTEKAPGSRPVKVVVFGKRARRRRHPSENGESPVPVVVNPKSTRASGTASFTIVIEPNFVFVKVHVTLSPAARVDGRGTRAGVTGPARAEQLRPVSVQPATALSVTENDPGSRPVNVVEFDNVASASSSRLNGDETGPGRGEPEVGRGCRGPRPSRS